jgi:hypothetical protein
MDGLSIKRAQASFRAEFPRRVATRGPDRHRRAQATKRFKIFIASLGCFAIARNDGVKAISCLSE